MAKPVTQTFLEMWIDSFKDSTLIILMVLAVVSLIIAGAVEHMKDLSWLDGTAILVTVLVVTSLEFKNLVELFIFFIFFFVICSCYRLE